MKKTKSQRFCKTRHAQQFVNWRSEFEDKYELDAYADPTEPVMLVNDTILSVRNATHNYRLIYILPWILGLWILFFIQIYDFGPNRGMINSANYMVELNSKKQDQGIEYDKKRDMYYRTLVGEDGNGSRLNLIHAVTFYGDKNYRAAIYTDIILISILLVISILATLGGLRFPRFADIYFDRKRGIVYTWRFGKVAACKFKNLGVREDKLGLVLFLYGEDKKHGYWAKSFYLQPTGRAHFNTENDNTFLMTQLFAFMGKGKSAVITEERFERPQPKSYLFIDKKPENFEQRLEEILKRDDRLPELYAEHAF
ncbi:hypothetical protein ACTFQF_03870 [Aliivibrio fischeri]|uniref:hypothetical protein n=1 Tax=Aliivibrio fischeri TaxID=668 RepID=UPI0007C4B5B7|nr:hypothetical protein [Aliivibrio fischeri]MBP3140402.1 hypothetical protein [Aliivibrio fischeri]MBP3156279.1 hypothetical protein [Aliivibrio fischeri]MCE7575636.1 hypothetical protein [Aliivibrio fischeri]